MADTATPTWKKTLTILVPLLVGVLGTYFSIDLGVIAPADCPQPEPCAECPTCPEPVVAPAPAPEPADEPEAEPTQPM